MSQRITVDEIRKDLGDDKYINSFKARRYIEFLLSEYEKLRIIVMGDDK